MRLECDAVAGDGVLDGANFFERDRFAIEHAGEDFCRIGLSVCFNVWKFPKVRIDDIARALADEESAAMFGDKGHEMSGRRGRAFGEIGELLL